VNTQALFRVVLMGTLLTQASGCVEGQDDAGADHTVAAAGLDTARMLEDVARLSHDSMAGRAVGTPGNAAARRMIAERFQSLGVTPLGETFLQPFTYTADDETREGTNVIGYVPGTERPNEFLIVTAHFDHLGVRNGQVYNGADDNASGTAALLALAEWFSENPGLHSIAFAAVDAEEQGLQGARAFVTNPPIPLGQIALNVNLDMISHSDSVLYAAGTHHYPYLRSYLEDVAERSDIVLRFGHDSPDLGENDDWTNASDHGPFHSIGVSFIYFGVEDHPDYHQPTDDFERINRQFYVDAVETILDAIREFDRHLEELAVTRRGR
jgi:Zn-dependent M28 family amino/carboxypeptidase